MSELLSAGQHNVPEMDKKHLFSGSDVGWFHYNAGKELAISGQSGEWKRKKAFATHTLNYRHKTVYVMSGLWPVKEMKLAVAQKSFGCCCNCCCCCCCCYCSCICIKFVLLHICCCCCGFTYEAEILRNPDNDRLVSCLPDKFWPLSRFCGTKRAPKFMFSEAPKIPPKMCRHQHSKKFWGLQ